MLSYLRNMKMNVIHSQEIIFGMMFGQKVSSNCESNSCRLLHHVTQVTSQLEAAVTIPILVTIRLGSWNPQRSFNE